VLLRGKGEDEATSHDASPTLERTRICYLQSGMQSVVV
jgi:hypothetical protein